MFPGLVLHKTANSGFADIKGMGKRSKRFSLTKKTADDNNIRLSQFRKMTSRPMRHPLLLRGVLSVGFWSPKKQMERVHAPTIITPVTDKHVLRNHSVMPIFKGKAMRPNRMTRRFMKLTIPALKHIRLPLPTAIQTRTVSAARDITPKTRRRDAERRSTRCRTALLCSARGMILHAAVLAYIVKKQRAEKIMALR
jgi:hypothetical protein